MLTYAIYGILSMPHGPHCRAYYSNCAVIGHFTCQTATTLGQAGCCNQTLPLGRVGSGHETILFYVATCTCGYIILQIKCNASIHASKIYLRYLKIYKLLHLKNSSSSFYGAKGSHGECGVPYARKFPMPRPSLNETW